MTFLYEARYFFLAFVALVVALLVVAHLKSFRSR